MDESRRLLLRGPGIVLAAGAHDALSAKLAEQAGFDAIWAGGFGISAVQAVPDANILTLTETLEAVRRIVDAVAIPVVADCDNGYGNAINVMRTAAEFERAGAAGICIEDNEFPERCSFYAGVRRDLVPAEEHARKVEAATAARRDPGFLVIARTEALIAGLGQEEALRRARAYANAGADAVLVHSKAHDFTELRAFAAAWDRPVPLVAVPTTYPTVAAAELAAAGFRMAIFANQALRAAIVAMRDALGEMRRSGTAASVEERIASLEEVYALVGVPELRANEQRFLFAGDEAPRAVPRRPGPPGRSARPGRHRDAAQRPPLRRARAWEPRRPHRPRSRARGGARRVHRPGDVLRRRRRGAARRPPRAGRPRHRGARARERDPPAPSAHRPRPPGRVGRHPQGLDGDRHHRRLPPGVRRGGAVGQGERARERAAPPVVAPDLL